jgi:hypothetical protein
MTTTTAKTPTPKSEESTRLLRILSEGYGPGAWHGADFKAAIGDVDAALAFWRPAPGRHNIAEIALHHAYYVRDVRGRIGAKTAEPFVVSGEDWFEASNDQKLSWSKIQAVVEAEQAKLVTIVDKADSSGGATLSPAERLNLVLGITCHAVYHAGQVQLIKRLHADV